MSNVQLVYITKEVAEILGVSTAHVLRIAKEMNFSEREFRAVQKTNLFSAEAVVKLKRRLNKY